MVHWMAVLSVSVAMQPTFHLKLERDCDSWNSWEKQAFLRLTCYTITSQLCDLFSNMRAAWPCCHLSLSQELSNHLEDLQCRALQIIFSNMQYDKALRLSNISCLAERRRELSRTFFQRIIRNRSNILWYLLPAMHDLQITAQLRSARQYPTICADITD